MKRLLILLLVIGFTHLLSFGQSPEEKAKRIVKSFITDIYRAKESDIDIAKKYISLSSDTSEFSEEKRYEMAAYNISLFRSGKTISQLRKSPLADEELANLSIISYQDMDKKMLPNFEFNKSLFNNIYALQRDGSISNIFFVENNKISAFDFMVKGQGGPAYFIGY